MFTWKAAGLMLAATVMLPLPAAAGAAQGQATLDITRAVIVAPTSGSRPVEYKAAVMLREEVEKRTGLSWLITSRGRVPAGRPAIYVGSLGSLPSLGASLRGFKPVTGADGKPAADGYVLVTPKSARAGAKIMAIGNDRRGALFAAGRLLRAMTMTKGKVAVPAGMSIASAPKYRYRGHQLGHRAGANDTMDAWTIAEYEQYVRDLIVFGANSVEIIPWLSRDEDDMGAVMTVNPYDMGLQMCKMLDSYDMDVWMWLPLATGSVKSADDRAKSLEVRRQLFAKCKRIDHVFVPGGDPGDTPPPILMPYLKDLARVLRSEHPKAGLWVSTQGFESENLNYFYEYLQQNQPDWLAGVVYGPWAKDTLEHTRQAVPKRYPIRQYPDETHSVRSQYPIPNWDEVWAQTFERQPIMPRPTQYAHTCNVLAKYADGAVAYSDGTGDDVNKAIWSAMLWDPKADVRAVLVQYGRYFIGPDFAQEVADGLLALEKNWVGPALTNASVPATLLRWQEMDARASVDVKRNWRFQQFVLRAHVDALVQKRLQRDTGLLDQARDLLRRFVGGQLPEMTPDVAMEAAEEILNRAVAPELREKIEDLAAELKQSIGMQLGAKYGASSADRGAVLDTMDRPVTDGEWWKERFAELRQVIEDEAKVAGIREIIDWEDPGPGGFYDDLGNGANGKQPHLVTEPGWQTDPGYIISPKDEHGGPSKGPMSWRNQAETLHWTPLRMRYEGLDPNATYRLKAVYAGRYSATLQLSVDGQKLGEPIKSPKEGVVVEFQIPQEATADGVLELQWDKTEGRGAQVAEVWLIRQ